MDIHKIIDDLKAEHLVQRKIVMSCEAHDSENSSSCQLARHSASVISGAICLLEEYERLQAQRE